MKVPSRRVVIEYPSGVRRALPTTALATEVERLAGYTAELGLGQLVLSILPPERESAAAPPSSKTVAVPRAARRSKAPTPEPATATRSTPKRKRAPTIDLKALLRETKKPGFVATEYADRIGVAHQSIWNAIRRARAK